VLGKLIVDGVTYEVPDETDWELGELNQIEKLRGEYGQSGALVGAVWLVKHRQDPSFTVEKAQKLKLGQVEEVTATPDPPTTSSAPENDIDASAAKSSSTAAPAPSGAPSTRASTG
jgi:hypothetical protein